MFMKMILRRNASWKPRCHCLPSLLLPMCVCVCVFSDGRKLFDVVHFPCVPLIITAALCVIMNALLLLLREPRLPCWLWECPPPGITSYWWTIQNVMILIFPHTWCQVTLWDTKYNIHAHPPVPSLHTHTPGKLVYHSFTTCQDIS